MGAVIEIRQEAHQKLGRDLSSSARLSALCQTVSATFAFNGTSGAYLLCLPSDCLNDKARENRSVAIYAAREVLHTSLPDLASHFRCSETEVCEHHRWVAAKRERNPKFDRDVHFLLLALGREARQPLRHPLTIGDVPEEGRS